VQGKVLSEGELQGLRGEDDIGTVFLDGQAISIEKAFDWGNNWAIQAYNGDSNTNIWQPVLWSGKNVQAFGSNNRSDGKKGFAQDWGYTSPANGVNKDNFYLKFWTQADFQQGQTYNFNVKADDKYALAALPVGANNANQWEWISERKWNGDAFEGKTIQFTPKNSGKYWVGAYYYENLNTAYFDISWDKATPVPNTITVENKTFPVELWSYNASARAQRSNIDPNKDTIVVIHGRGDGNADTDITKLVEKAANSYANSQVLALDWKEAANETGQWEGWGLFWGRDGDIPYEAASRIRPVADWAVKKLKELGIDPQKTILLGHSLGSYVASEIGRIGGKVKELVALDPAYPASKYDIDGNNPGPDTPVDFRDVANKSIALVASDREVDSGAAGDNEKANSAHDSYIVDFTDYPSWQSPIQKISDYHKAVVGVYSDILANQLTIPSKYYPSFQNDRYDNNGIGYENSIFPRHDGLITVDLTNREDPRIKQLRYVDSNNIEQTTWNWL
jgi:pimeloyl-ACP methyl ester carboxylesterase